MTTQKRLPLSLSVLITIFPLLSETLYSPTLPNIANSFNLSALGTNFTTAAFYLGLFIGTIFWYKLLPPLGQRFCLLVGFLLYGPGAILGLTAECGWTLFGARLMEGFGISVGLWIVPTLSSQRKGVADENLLSITALLALVLTPLIGLFIGGYLAEAFGFKSYFIILGIYSLILFLVSYYTFPADTLITVEQNKTENLFARLRQLTSDRQTFIALIIFSLCGIMFFGYCASAPFILINVVGLSPSQYGCLGLFIILPCLLGGFISTQLIKVFARFKIIWLGSIISFAGSLMLPAITLFPITNNLLSATLYWVICTSIVWFGIGLIFLSTLHYAVGEERSIMEQNMPLVGLFLWAFATIGTALLGILGISSLKIMPLYLLVISTITLVFSFYLQTDRKLPTLFNFKK